MADNQPLFRSEAVDQLNDSGDLDKALKVVTPRVWIVLAAIVALLIGIISWGFFGAVSTTVSVKAVHTDDGIICLVPTGSSKKVAVGNPAQVDDHSATVSNISSVPLSRNEVKDLLGNDYLVSAAMQGDWAFLVDLKLEDKDDLARHVPLNTVITTERISPVELITGEEG